jgi:hypothetical protein
MKAVFLSLLAEFLFTGCKKSVTDFSEPEVHQTITNQFVQYTIRKNQHYCDQSSYKTIETSFQKFIVRFDSTAIYQTLDPVNQYDINKLIGFSDNNLDHHQFSARFGWRWSDGSLRLFAYVYNNGLVSSEELATISIGQEILCSIQVTANSYIFMVNDLVKEMPRTSTTTKAVGYKLFPYFGGDETAPHDFNIWIKELN